MLGGIIFQLVSMTLFVYLVIEYIIRYNKNMPVKLRYIDSQVSIFFEFSSKFPVSLTESESFTLIFSDFQQDERGPLTNKIALKIFITGMTLSTITLFVRGNSPILHQKHLLNSDRWLQSGRTGRRLARIRHHSRNLFRRFRWVDDDLVHGLPQRFSPQMGIQKERKKRQQAYVQSVEIKCDIIVVSSYVHVCLSICKLCATDFIHAAVSHEDRADT